VGGPDTLATHKGKKKVSPPGPIASTAYACGRNEERKNKERNFRASNWLFTQTTHGDVGP